MELAGNASQALETVREAADIWGGDWQPRGSGGRLTLPVSAGLRHGHVIGEVSAQDLGGSARLVFYVEKSHYQLHVASLAILLMGALGGLVLVLWPFYPVLLELTPVGVVLSLTAWFLVASKLKTRGPTEFLNLLTELQEGERGE